MTQILEIDTTDPSWEWDLEKAIAKFHEDYGVEPHMIVGGNFADALMERITWIKKEDVYIRKEEEFKPGKIAYYRGIPFEYDPDISCVILKA